MMAINRLVGRISVDPLWEYIFALIEKNVEKILTPGSTLCSSWNKIGENIRNANKKMCKQGAKFFYN